MKLALSTIALGVGLACASQVASSQTVTVTQQGSGNTIAAEQVNTTPDAVFDAFTNASITQIGNDNHVGGPGATSGGIYQVVSPRGGARAIVSQTGTGNNAGITQDGRPGSVPPPVVTVITQKGNGNDATISQTNAVSNDVSVDQNGSGNLARLRQVDTGDASLHVTQDGIGNTATVDHLRSSHGGPQVTQTGEGNTVSLVVDHLLGHGAVITQTGSMNNASVQLIEGETLLTISQQGIGNFVGANATGYGHSATINQIGNSNSALLSLPLQANTLANISQTGSGNWSNVYQH
jgi:hypothetical protein